jgi:SAM-dependent methyltransferase
MKEKDYYQTLLDSREYNDSRLDKARLISVILAGLIGPWTENIVDLGSGSGRVKEYLERELGKPIIGVEYDRPFIQYRANTCAGDVSYMPIKSGCIDLAICNHLFEHVDKKPEFIADLKRVMKDKGFVYFTICNKYKLIEPHYRLPFLSWLPNSWADIYLRLAGRGRAYRDIKFYAYKELVGMFVREGFTVKNITWEVISKNSGKLSPVQRIVRGVMNRLGEPIREALIDALSPQWFLIISKNG